MIIVYKIITTILYPFLFLFLLLRKLKKKEDPKRFKEKILVSHFNIKNKGKSKLIWFHAASIGEYKSIIPIIRQLNIKNNNLKFLITTTTLSSGNLAAKEIENFSNVEHRYFPFDVPFLIKKFLHLWKPDNIFLVDSEIWPNLILNAKKLNIPLALINARLTPKSFDKWMIFPNEAKKIFRNFDLFICSNLRTKNYLEKLQLNNIFFKGNIKLINQIDKEEIADINESFCKNNKFWFAASIHQEEDVFCLKTHLEIKKKLTNIVTIIAPRHIDRSENIYSLAKKLNLDAQILNKNETISKDVEVVIINYFGALQNYFKHSKSVFIGKSILEKFKNNGGQNPIEAAKLNCKIYHGPYVFNFDDIYEIFAKNNISQKVEDHHKLAENLTQDLTKSIEKNIEISDSIKNLEQTTLNDTMTLVNEFIFHGNK